MAAHPFKKFNRLCLSFPLQLVWSIQWTDINIYFLEKLFVSSLALSTTARHARRAGRPGWPLTLMPSMRKPRVAVELSVSLHCMYLGLRTPCWALSCSVGAPGSTATIFSYMSLRKRGRSLAFISSSSRYVLKREGLIFNFHFFYVF